MSLPTGINQVRIFVRQFSFLFDFPFYKQYGAILKQMHFDPTYMQGLTSLTDACYDGWFPTFSGVHSPLFIKENSINPSTWEIFQIVESPQVHNH